MENLLNYQNHNLAGQNIGGKLNKSNTTKTQELDNLPLIEKQEKIVEKELQNTNNSNKEDLSNKKKNVDDMLTSNTKEKKVISMDLTIDEKIVYSQLGINPLIKLGKEYITSNNLVLLEDEENKDKADILNSTKKSTTKINTKKQSKKILKSKVQEEIEEKSADEEVNTKNTLPKIINENEEVEVIEKGSELELTDEINNTRKKRRRSSASIE